ncbi:MAG: FAD-dependent oxidoreductase, partial [Spirochaetia bacterium]|nr:FAD-dependent oxidoreductase [Spirochaetia bacterium]
VGKHVVIIGGGNAAIDAGRTAMRLGAESVKIVYRRSQSEMPAYAEEVSEAVREGVEIMSLTQPIEIIKNPDGTVSGLRCMPMELGGFDKSGRRRPQEKHEESFTLKSDQVIIAIGQRLNAGKLFSGTAIQLDHRNFVSVDPVTGKTSDNTIYAGGDCVEGPSSVVRAIAAGERAAAGIDLALTGKDNAFWRFEKVVDTDFDPDADPVMYPREKIREIPLERRKNNFEEVELPWDEKTAQRQAHRCLRCDYGKKIRLAEDKEEAHV